MKGPVTPEEYALEWGWISPDDADALARALNERQPGRNQLLFAYEVRDAMRKVAEARKAGDDG